MNKTPVIEYLWPPGMFFLSYANGWAPLPMFVCGMWTAILLAHNFGWRKES